MHPIDARAIFLHNGLLCNGKCSLTGGGHKRKDPNVLTKNDVVVGFYINDWKKN